MATQDLTLANFRQTVYGNDNVLVYVWAPLCAPCDVFTPTYEESSDKYPDIVYGKVNYETEQELVSMAQVKHLPTLMAFKKGKLVFKQAGIANPNVMDDLVGHLRVWNVPSPASRRGLL
ncbi:Thioredoxin [Mycobacterium basiliense]|uniref:Thioredoxin n=1 Tax=Mycobacterium basiliense TaxID=2094119 RepID=A0A447GDI8_9MYCO|nr:thioredoxin domain-containing protein [Mycobacterium basiliense]VDM88542.1 Thioredoxin [Mycobacterium basiliense]